MKHITFLLLFFVTLLTGSCCSQSSQTRTYELRDSLIVDYMTYVAVFYDSAFVDCDAFAAIFYYGTEEEWQSTDISSGNGGNAAILEAKFYIYSESEPQDAQRE